MDSKETRPEAECTSRFERELERLIAESFARGETVERTWTIETPVTDAPDWTVRIDRTYSADDPPYEPTLLDE